MREGEALAGALNRGARRQDVLPLGALRVDGESRYRVRLSAELREDDTYESLALQIVDHAPGTEIVAGPGGALLAVRDARGPSGAWDAAGRDRLAPLAAGDGETWNGADTRMLLDGEIRDWTVVELPRPASGGEAVLIVRGRNTLTHG